MSFTVFLGNLPIWVTADEIKQWLSAEDLVADSVKVIRNHETQESKGFAFVEAPTADEMQAIIRRFDRAPLEDKLLRANPAQPSKGKGQPGNATTPPTARDARSGISCSWFAPSPYRQARSGKRTEKRLRHGIGKSSVTGVRSCSQPLHNHTLLCTRVKGSHVPQLPISRILKQYRQWHRRCHHRTYDFLPDGLRGASLLCR